MVCELLSRRDIERARDLIRRCALDFEDDFDNLLGIFEDGRLVATGARSGRVLKMLAIDPDRQGGDLLGRLLGELTRLGYEAGRENFFIFTRPASTDSFRCLNFVPLVRHPEAVLLETGGGLARYLLEREALVRPGENGALVVNCNPFTFGHRHLVEQAAARVPHLYLFVVREELSAFPFAARLRLVREGVRDLPNVRVLDSGDYAVSAATFPAYFLKRKSGAARIQMEMDLLLFAEKIAPFFGIGHRFIGTEPYCRTTRDYSRCMRKLLPPRGIEVTRIERLEAEGEPISAYGVRRALAEGDFERLRALVPPTTLAYLLSEEGRAIGRRLLTDPRRH